MFQDYRWLIRYRVACHNLGTLLGWLAAATIFLSTFVFLSTLSSSVAMAQTADRQQIEMLVEQLGDRRFEIREQASAKLLELGTAAVPVLEEASQADNYELRLRSSIVKEEIQQREFDRLSSSFLLDRNPTNSYGLPAWDAFRQIVGSSRTSKLLFLSMLRDQRELAEMVHQLASLRASPESDRERSTDLRPAMRKANDDPPSELHAVGQSGVDQQSVREISTQLAARAAKEAQALREQLMKHWQEPTIGDAVGLLLSTAAMESQAPVEVNEMIDQFIRRATFSSYLRKQGYQDCLRSLMSAWIPKTHESMAGMALYFSMQYDLPEGAEIAREHLGSNFDVGMRTQAFQCLARFGQQQDLALVEAYFDNNTIVDMFSEDIAWSGGDIHIALQNPPGIQTVQEDDEQRRNMVVRVADLAIATAMLLREEDQASILEVFPNFQTSPTNAFAVRGLASPMNEDAIRTKRIQNWKARQEWLERPSLAQ